MKYLVVARYELPDGALATKMYFHPAFANKADALNAAARINKPPPRPVCSCCGGPAHGGNIPYADSYKIVMDVEPEPFDDCE